MIKSIIAIIILIMAESARRFYVWRNFKKNPIGMRCRFFTKQGWLKGDVEGRITKVSYYVFADDGNMWRTSIEFMRPVYWEL
jgi:starvation-inducible outer membrane lipoprotein